MAKLPVTIACGPYDRMEAIRTGDVQIEGIDPTYVTIQSPPEIFARMVKTGSFDVAEMSTAYYLIRRAQGDFPFISVDTIRRSLEPLVRDSDIPMGTAATRIATKREFMNRNVVKVVTDGAGFASYFSRAPIPYHRQSQPLAKSGATGWGKRHLGIYVYQRKFLLEFARLSPAPLEAVEGLEQLRALHHGFRIRVADVEEPTVEVDTPADLETAQKYWTRLHTREQHG